MLLSRSSYHKRIYGLTIAWDAIEYTNRLIWIISPVTAQPDL